MKRVLISNKFYYSRGGDCIASMALERLLLSKGHDVAFFSTRHPQNFPSAWEPFFLPGVDFAGGIGDKLKAANRLFRSKTVKDGFLRLIDTFRPDIVHLNNIHSYISPYIGEIAHRKGIKVVWTLHDYKPVCPAYVCLRGGKTCELCLKKGPCNVFLHKCMKQSLPASLLAWMEAAVWSRKRLAANTDRFIAPSRFMKGKMVEGGFPADKIRVVPNFTDRAFGPVLPAKEDYYCYVGRLSEEKGVKTLVGVARELPHRLVVVGTGPLKDFFHADNKTGMAFVGFKEWDEIRLILQKARFMIIPSEWYENNPISVIESQCLGTPVLGAAIGGIPEVIDERRNGLLFEAGNPGDLREKIGRMYREPFDYGAIAREARRKYSADSYYEELMKIYDE